MFNPTAALKRVYASAPYDDVILHTIELSHSQFSKVWYLVDYPTAIEATLEDTSVVNFEPMRFSVKLPKSDAQGGQLLNVSFANIGRVLTDELEAASTIPTERLSIVFRVYLLSVLNMPQAAPIRLSIDSVAINIEAITAEAGRSDVLNQPFPRNSYDPSRFPGLDR